MCERSRGCRLLRHQRPEAVAIGELAGEYAMAPPGIGSVAAVGVAEIAAAM
jgi:hypothetical protein